ncbi:TPA: tRNA lysidine(34) synthetase TilS [Candidatus Acetothermia bacterium]|nr:tRNA lysidine(34) synthetase TilS [Candidatus Acetothermia bacterium]
MVRKRQNLALWLARSILAAPVVHASGTVGGWWTNDARASRITAMLDKVREAVTRFGLLVSGEHVVVAVSAGADSMALLHVLHRLRDEFALSLTVAHLDHGIRAGTGEDLALVQAAAKELGLPLVHERADVPAFARERRLNLEEAARLVRREFLERAAREVGATRIALGHTRSDIAETVLLHLLRGAGTRGLRGILPVSPPYVRPLVYCSREEARAFCHAEGVRFRDDPTNEDRRLLRNAIRLEVLPILARHNPRVEEALARAAGLLAEAEDALRWTADLALAEISLPDGLDLDLLRGLPPSVQSLVVRRAAEAAGVNLEERHVGVVLEGVRDGWGEVHLPGGLSARIGSGVLSLARADGTRPVPAAWDLPAAGEATITELGWAFDLSPVPRSESLVPPSPFVAYFDVRRFVPPLVVRTPRAGDRLRPLGLRGTKKVSDLLMEARIPRWERARWPLLCDGRGIAWVVGVRPSEDHRVSMQTTDVLRVEARRA